MHGLDFYSPYAEYDGAKTSLVLPAAILHTASSIMDDNDGDDDDLG